MISETVLQIAATSPNCSRAPVTSSPTQRPSPRSPAYAANPARRWLGLVVVLLVASGGCAEAPLPGQEPRSQDCLRGLSLDQLGEQLQRCDRLVASQPNQPGPLNDRSLVRSLAGDEAGACQDIDAAKRLLARQPRDPENDVLMDELNRRQAICKAPRRAPAPPTSPPSTGAP